MGQTLSPQMQQSLQFLQAPAMELQALVQQEIEINPVLEETPDQDKPEAAESPSDTENWDKQLEDLRQKDQDWREYFAQSSTNGTSYNPEAAERRQFLFDSQVEAPHLAEHLQRQLTLATSDADILRVGEEIIGNIDDAGFLKVQLVEVAQSSRVEYSVAQATLDLMTEELASAYESLSTIFRFSAELADQPKPEEFARKWLGEVSKIAAADWFVLRLIEEGQGLKLVASSSAPTAGLREVLSLENAGVMDVSVELRAASFRIDVWFDTGHSVPEMDPLFPLAQRGGGFSHPIVINDRLLGVLSVGRHNADASFQAGQVSIIQTFADFLGIQIRNSQFQQQQLQTRLTARELEIAAEIQR